MPQKQEKRNDKECGDSKASHRIPEKVNHRIPRLFVFPIFGAFRGPLTSGFQHNSKDGTLNFLTQSKTGCISIQI